MQILSRHLPPRSSALLSQALYLPATSIPALLKCNPKASLGSLAALNNECYTFAFAPYQDLASERKSFNSKFIHDVITTVTTDNALPKINSNFGPIGFETETDMLMWLLLPANQGKVNVAVYFDNATEIESKKNVKYRLRYNDTQTCTDFGTKCTNVLQNQVLPLQLALDGAFVGNLQQTDGMEVKEKNLKSDVVKSSNFTISMKPFPHPDLPFKRDAMQQYGDMFLFAAFMFNFILQLSYLVTEKELRLREAMKQMGLKNSAYWISW